MSEAKIREAGQLNATGEPSRARREAATDGNGKVFPPDSPVQVPTRPAQPDARTPDAASETSAPMRDANPDSNWADSTKPRPNAKNARSHLR